MVQRSTSEESISSSDLTSTSSDDSSSSENGETTAESDGRRSTDPGVTESSRSANDRKSTESRKRSKTRPKGRLNAAYEDLVGKAHDDMILTGEREGAQTTRSSTIWTPREKEVFFRAVERHGQDDLRILAEAVSTKSPLEVRAYLLLCQDASHDGGSLQPSGSNSPSVALEIGQECEEALDLAADDLARHEQCREIEAEKARFGASWLIDEDAAATNEIDHLETVTKDEDQLEGSVNESESISTQISPSPNLLNPAAFLQLSRHIFMNAAPLSGNNWRDISPYDEASSSPAIFHSAFDDLHQTVVDVARRLVQATLLQATSRIRAKANGNPSPEVKQADVAIACGLLGLPSNSRKYWASVARRSGIDVYTRSTKYRKRHDDEHYRVRLTYDEIETELGFPPIARASATKTTLSGEPGTSASEDSDTDSIASHGSQAFSESLSSHDTEDATDNDDELDKMDAKQSRAEERRLTQMLMLKSKIEPSSDEESLQTSNSKAKRRKRRPSNGVPQWRKRVRYEAEWERNPQLSVNGGQHVHVQGNESKHGGMTAPAPSVRHSHVPTTTSAETRTTSESSDDAELWAKSN
ncbi:hypothetical protein BDY17DRAFT_304199 [Neohortaea acidophila]|uniref:Myb-like domain-containing protein n=1 Tax=Neohortaea acidophila TaxID=245834 RepID=A0A6A6PJ59_9PEZI|nr:uncharacterized protein BDY17DRAFT_304199 [Neohortaea acidophila]KAF2479563.1 hypothetical protein BDY17DRAFT_304199 [Neohortaea acidophila]